MTIHEGGCLCGQLRLRTTAAPVRVSICHCRFCQRNTGSAFMVEPIFAKPDFALVAGVPRTFAVISAGSGKRVTVHFCDACGGRTHLSFERFAEVVGVFAGCFDDPNWFARSGDNARHIFTSVAQRGTVLPPGVATYPQHALANDGTPNASIVLPSACIVGSQGA
jgi:hypothetical protein